MLRITTTARFYELCLSRGTYPFSKMDLVDGYWRMVVEPEVRWNFAYIMSSRLGEPIKLVIPRALRLG